jgi:hypothetical protein
MDWFEVIKWALSDPGYRYKDNQMHERINLSHIEPHTHIDPSTIYGDHTYDPDYLTEDDLEDTYVEDEPCDECNDCPEYCTCGYYYQ